MPYDPAVPLSPGFVEQVPAFLAGDDTPRDLLERCIAVIETRESDVQAFVTLNLEGARAAADAAGARYKARAPRSLVDGLPIGLKDIIETADMPTQCGSPIYEGNETGRDAPLTAALRRGGAVIVGKTASTEFAYGNVMATCNPFDPNRTPGTSSSGSAAAVGAGMLPVAIGTQLMSSVMRPASYCGQVGVKPTYGAIRQAGIHPFSPSGEHVGAHTAKLADAWAVLRFLSNEAGPVPGSHGIAGPETLPPAEKPARLMRMYTPGWDIADGSVRAAFEAGLDRLSNAGVEIIEPAGVPELQALEDDFARADWCIAEIAAFEMRWPFFEYEAAGHTHHPRIAKALARAHEITLADYHTALDFKAAFGARVRAASETIDGVVGLTAPEVAPVGLENIGNPVTCSPATCAGAPSLTLPLLAADDMPLGLQLIGFHGEDARLFGQAAWVEEVFG
ncbi:MAG: amidase [Alphaproteobacteria bacterium]|nr:amidase [Alphaproteobacteria bacterium]